MTNANDVFRKQQNARSKKRLKSAPSKKPKLKKQNLVKMMPQLRRSLKMKKKNLMMKVTNPKKNELLFQ